jgi:hypothetical protein
MVGRRGRKGSLEKRLSHLERQLIGPSKPRCRLCGREGGVGVTMEWHHYPSGEVTYGGKSEPLCPGCLAVNGRMGLPATLVVCEYYGRGAEGESCPICGRESLATIRAKLASGEMTTSEVPPMVEVGPRRMRRGPSPREEN